ncbi:MAG: aldehyde dehydrogenase [Candidatus Eremiobacteraeota bacterium]|nr:aldehyde dehydrogenase [Candidatus Eremiobacteraeota bacterium]
MATGVQRTQLFIDGRFVDAAGGETFEDRAPATSELLAHVASGGARDVDRAVAAARRAFDGGPWPRMPAAQRAKVLRRLGALLLENADALAKLEARDAGKPFKETAHRDVPRAADNCAFFASAIEQRAQQVTFDRKPFLGSEREIVSLVREEPVGVCALLTPWNSPLMQATWKIAPALAAGNTCVLKPSELTPLSTLKLAELCSAAGVPDGVVNVVTGFGADAGAPLVADARVDAVAFTGSVAVGTAINVAAAQTLKKVTLELGGKSANIVFDDADLELALEGSVLAMFRHSGQVCLAGTRLFVQAGIYETFVERYLERVRALRVGDPESPESDLGPLISAPHRARVEGFIERALAEGATALLHGGRPAHAELANGHYLEPSIFAPPSDEIAVAREEIFGPVLSLFQFETLDEVVARANDTRFGLSAYVWTRDVGTGMRAAERLHSGMVWINGYFIRDLRQPFGGVKESGLGREGGRWSLDFFTEPKLVCIAY